MLIVKNEGPSLELKAKVSRQNSISKSHDSEASIYLNLVWIVISTCTGFVDTNNSWNDLNTRLLLGFLPI